MSHSLALWDQISLGLILLFVVIFIALKIKKLFSPGSGGCANCASSGQCSAPLTKQRLKNQENAHIVSVESIAKNKCLRK